VVTLAVDAGHPEGSRPLPLLGIMVGQKPQILVIAIRSLVIVMGVGSEKRTPHITTVVPCLPVLNASDRNGIHLRVPPQNGLMTTHSIGERPHGRRCCLHDPLGRRHSLPLSLTHLCFDWWVGKWPRAQVSGQRVRVLIHQNKCVAVRLR
jgi:hypothetical protein